MFFFLAYAREFHSIQTPDDIITTCVNIIPKTVIPSAYLHHYNEAFASESIFPKYHLLTQMFRLG